LHHSELRSVSGLCTSMMLVHNKTRQGRRAEQALGKVCGFYNIALTCDFHTLTCAVGSGRTREALQWRARGSTALPSGHPCHDRSRLGQRTPGCRQNARAWVSAECMCVSVGRMHVPGCQQNAHAWVSAECTWEKCEMWCWYQHSARGQVNGMRVVVTTAVGASVCSSS
jgi:hypothetical protein